MKQCLSAKITTLLQRVPVVGHLSRQKFVAHFIIGLIKSRHVHFCEVAQHLNDAVKLASNEIRIQDFFRRVRLDADALAHLLLLLLPGQGAVRLCVDRTGWHFGRCQVNLLLISAGRGAWQVPLYWQLLDNRGGNSTAAERIALLTRCVTLLGRAQIALVLGDREFGGRAWFAWLTDQGLPFVMRVPKHHPLVYANGQRRPVAQLGLVAGRVRHVARVQVDGVWGQARVQLLEGGDFFYLFASDGLRGLATLYARRWGIEQCFQNLKGRGFDLEKTHLRCPNKLHTLLALVSLAYAFCLRVGHHAREQGAPVARKNHGYPANSLSRHGLNRWRQISRPNTSPADAIAQQVLALLEWLAGQVACYQRPVKIVG